jgi:hypothetical protein
VKFLKKRLKKKRKKMQALTGCANMINKNSKTPVRRDEKSKNLRKKGVNIEVFLLG